MPDRPAPAVHRDLAWALKQQATRAGESAPSVRGADWRTAVVTAVGGDGTVAVDGIPAIRCLETYLAPKVGDWIVIEQSSSGNWITPGRPAAPSAPSGTWTAIPLLAGFTTPHSIFGPAQYRVITVAGTVRVELRGSVTCTSAVTAQVNFSSALPVIARPAYARTMTCRRQVSSDTKGVTAIEVTTGGVLQIHGLAAPNTTTWFAIDGCYYDI
ncbi:hypothetical protein [Streptomyces sp. enrichment culture]|uniref:hypothetical protein n=1 Tax=Streptomyces sp. enrichment culture TaxID=1795815 RepID=UPI003F544760